ncbi:hypothetical protein OF83DRAFT_1136959 [Amylostereum chailletii]|nr:hypothetical protein OF83DRAFT_1136959 [Amylostereum chailletii]
MTSKAYPKFTSKEHISCNFCCEKIDAPKPLRCSACHITTYCGKECQKKDWKQHKPRCSIMNTEANPELKKADPATGKTQLQVRRDMEKWYLIHRSTLSVALRQILQLDLYPDRVDDHGLEIGLVYNPSPSASKARLFMVDSIKVHTALKPDQIHLPRLRQLDRPDLRAGVDLSNVKPGDEFAALLLTYKHLPDCGIVQGTLIEKVHFLRLYAENWLDWLPRILEGRINDRLATDSFYIAMSEYVKDHQEHILDPDKCESPLIPRRDSTDMLQLGQTCL